MSSIFKQQLELNTDTVNYSPLLNLFLENLPVAVAMLDRDLRYLVASRRWLTDYGLEGQNLIGRSHLEIFPNFFEDWEEIWQQCLAGAVKQGEAVCLIGSKGESLQVRWKIQPWRGADGEISGGILLTEEIEESHPCSADLNSEQTLQELQQTQAQLLQSWETERILKQVTDQIRSSLDLKTILQTIVREVRQLLSTDRVVIYQFTRGWQGEVVVEDVAEPWNPILGEVYADECFPREYAALYADGRIRAVGCVEESDLHLCHQEFLKEIQVQANLVVPIRQETDLWGLLIAHECGQVRIWQEAETNLLQQLADQAAIAIHQAELYHQTCLAAETAKAQAQELKIALQALKRTQAQLIQTEKMSSLGQLVAGVAHEINNPVNFIYGNLTPVDRYTKTLLEFVNLYQQHYPQPLPALKDLIEREDIEFISHDLPKILDSMKVGTNRIREIVLTLRNFTRLDEAEIKQVDIHQGIDSTLTILQSRLNATIDRPAIEVIKAYGNLPQVECLAGQMNQVFMNVLANAIDALEEKFGLNAETNALMIRIRTETIAEKAIAILIADNGAGMSAEVQQHMFEPFYTKKPVGKGTGLGLAISHQIVVDRHRGELNCRSSLEEGTEFTIQIPIHQPQSFK